MHDDITVGDEGRVCLAFEGAVGDHKGNVELLASEAAAWGRCCIDGSPLLEQHGGGNTESHVPVHKGRKPSGTYQHGSVDPCLSQHPVPA